MNNFITFFLFIFLSCLAVSVSAQDKAPVAPLSATGWDVATSPNVNNPDQETGQIVYEVEIDNLGNLVAFTVIKKEISDTLSQKCEAELRKMIFVKKVNSTSGLPISKGTITFVFRVD